MEALDVTTEAWERSTAATGDVVALATVARATAAIAPRHLKFVHATGKGTFMRDDAAERP